MSVRKLGACKAIGLVTTINRSNNVFNNNDGHLLLIIFIGFHALLLLLLLVFLFLFYSAWPRLKSKVQSSPWYMLIINKNINIYKKVFLVYLERKITKKKNTYIQVNLKLTIRLVVVYCILESWPFNLTSKQSITF